MLPEDILACPQCKQKVRKEEKGYICDKCKLLYPFNDIGVPIMLVKAAKGVN